MKYQQSYSKKFVYTILVWVHHMWVYLCARYRFLHWHLRVYSYLHGTKNSWQDCTKQTLLIIRHGQTTWNVEHRIPGQLPGIVLNTTGHQQAAQLAEALSVLPISAIISSPLERAYETATYLAQGRNLKIQQEPLLMDTDMGLWTGQISDDLLKKDSSWKAYIHDPTVAPIGVETFFQVQKRSIMAVENWRAKGNIGSYPVFVTHADVVALLIAYYTGLDINHATSISIDNASVSLIEIEKNRPPRVVAINWKPQTGWLKTAAQRKALQRTVYFLTNIIYKKRSSSL